MDYSNEFEAWIKNYPKHEYSEGVPKRYSRALKNAEKWLEITLPKPVLTINNKKDFQEAVQLIRDVHDYEEINKAHGNGELSAALRLYELFLESEYTSSTINNVDAAIEGWWPALSEYDPNLSAEEYQALFLDEKVVKRSWLKALYELYQMPGHLATCKQLGEQYGYLPSHYISYLSTSAANIARTTGCPVVEDGKNAKYWPVLFQGRNVADKNTGSYCWKMREPVVKAIESLIKDGFFEQMEEQGVSRFNRNLILYGPPGTGKTYNAVLYAVAICDGKTLEEVRNEQYSENLKRFNELKERGRIVFTTFHQSYGYEEFIEGIRPVLLDDEKSGSLSYEIKDGVFKKLCDAARTPEGKEINHNASIWFVRLKDGEANDLKEACFKDGEIR